MIPIALNEDHHVHSTFSDGRGTLRENLEVAEERGLAVLGCVDHVRADTAWVPEFARAVARLQRRTDVQLVCGVEAKMVDTLGRLDLPSELTGVDRVYIADHQFPVATGVFAPWRVKRALDQGWLRPEVAIRSLMLALTRAVDRCPRPAVIAHLGSILPKVGLGGGDVQLRDLEPLIDVCLKRGTVVELDERWKSPGLRLAWQFHKAGVPVVCSSDAHKPQDIGAYTWAPRVVEDLQWCAEDADRMAS